jgi:hypothetical protein
MSFNKLDVVSPQVLRAQLEMRKFLELAREVTLTKTPKIFEAPSNFHALSLRKKFYRLRDAVPAIHGAYHAVHCLTFTIKGKTLTVNTKLDWTKYAVDTAGEPDGNALKGDLPPVN